MPVYRLTWEGSRVESMPITVKKVASSVLILVICLNVLPV
jgi:hypothetical protein